MSTALPRLVVAGTHSGVGKTTVATGLMAALAARGEAVAPFKVGPDFIDPSYHRLATGRPGRNLDAVLSGTELLAPLAAHGAAGADVAVIEGVMGLFDGASGRGELASTAQIAKLLAAPVVLVVDAGAMARSVAALVHGYASFDPDLRLAGVIANRVGSPRHAALLAEALEGLGVPLLGCLPRDAALAAPSRHLGLVPAAEREPAAQASLDRLGAVLAEQLDLTALRRIAAAAPPLPAAAWSPAAALAEGTDGDEPSAPARAPRIAVAAGPAFTFTYPENLELLAAAGAELCPVDPLVDPALPAGTGGLYLGGGFPETYGEALAANTALRGEVAALARAGAPIVAECGGLLYLCGSLDGAAMCGVLDAEAAMTDALTLGYRAGTAAGDSPLWATGERVHGHEFHYSVTRPRAGGRPAWRLSAGDDADAAPEGFRVGGVHASYLHTHWAATPQAAARLVAAAAAAPAAAREGAR